MNGKSSQQPTAGIGAGLTFLLAASCGAIVSNIYVAQPLLGLIAPDVGLSVGAAGLVVMLTQLGYGLGVILLAPLGDLVDNRALVLSTIGVGLAALGLAAWADSGWLFLSASLLIGLGSVSVQMMVPIAAHLAPDAVRGRVVGNVVSGLLFGIMFARPVSSMVAHAFGWRASFMLSAALTALAFAALILWLPKYRPKTRTSYGALLISLYPLLRDTPILRWRTFYQTLQFGAFTLFWTAVPLELAGPEFGFSQQGIALFAFAGAAGAFAAPVAGRLADRGHSGAATAAALLAVAAGFVLSLIGAGGSLAALVAGAIVLDAGVQTSLVVGQRAIYSLGPQARGRLNAIYLSIFFAGGAASSALSSAIFAHMGWAAVAGIGLAFPVIALAGFFWQSRGKSGRT